MGKLISCHDAAALMASDKLYALLDVRERGEFNERQISDATSLPRNQIEFRLADLVPNPKIPLIVYDDTGERAALAASTFAESGYLEVSVIEGGLPAWEQGGYRTASGVNVPSKAFGERVQHERTIPDIGPEELRQLQESSADLIVLDVRTPEEYGRFCIPGGINIPGGDLILWANALRQKPQTHVIVNCAGRTRSIIGTAALRRLGLDNVRELRNGTMGWVLAGYALESNPGRPVPRAPSESREGARALALRVAEEEQLPWISAERLLDAAPDAESGVTYLIDVRSEEEYLAGHVPGSLSVPGGQAVQRADDFIAVRHGRIIFISNQAARAVMAAYWYRLMGYRNIHVLQGGLESWREKGGSLVSGVPQREPLTLAAAKKIANVISPAAVKSRLQISSSVVLDVGSSLEFDAAHIPGARWISRGWLEVKLPQELPNRSQSIVISCPDGQRSLLAARALSRLSYENVSVLDGGTRAWVAAGGATETGLTSCLTEPNDVVLSPSIRGSKEDMQRYLEWEVKLER